MKKEIRKINMFEYEIKPCLYLGVRECNLLKNMGIETIGDILYYCADDKDKFKKIRGIGSHSENGIKQLINKKIRDKRIYLGMPKEAIDKFKTNGNGYVIEDELIKTSIFEYELDEFITTIPGRRCLYNLNVKTVYDLFVFCSEYVDRLLTVRGIGQINKNSLISKIDDIILETHEPVYLGMPKIELDKYMSSRDNKVRRVSKIVGEDKTQEKKKSVIEPTKDEDLSFIEIIEEKFQNYDELCNCVRKLEEEVRNKETEIASKRRDIQNIEDKIKEYEALKIKKNDLEELSSRLDARIAKLLVEFNSNLQIDSEQQKLK